MRLGLVLASLLAVGCRQIFGVEPPDPLVDASPIDATDAMPGDVVPPAVPCFADDALMFGACLNAFPSSDVVFTDQLIDTDAVANCAPLASQSQDVCVIAGKDVTISATVVATGARPLVIWATGTITISGTLDVASHHASFGQPLLTGAGSGAGGCASPVPAAIRGGGAGGSFVTAGGAGGRDVTASGSIGGVAAVTTAASVFRGGCSGGDGSDSAMAGGPGGGALALVAPQVVIKGIVDASGAGGTQGGTAFRGGAGGGSGGMILVLAQSTMLAATGEMFANGGGGGGGGLNNATGGVGGDPANPASPGIGGTSQGQGTGGSGYPQVQDGRNSSILTACGGGGGGGGAGAIIVRGTLASSGSISPAPIN